MEKHKIDEEVGLELCHYLTFPPLPRCIVVTILSIHNSKATMVQHLLTIGALVLRGGMEPRRQQSRCFESTCWRPVKFGRNHIGEGGSLREWQATRVGRQEAGWRVLQVAGRPVVTSMACPWTQTSGWTCLQRKSVRDPSDAPACTKR